MTYGTSHQLHHAGNQRHVTVVFGDSIFVLMPTEMVYAKAGLEIMKFHAESFKKAAK